MSDDGPLTDDQRFPLLDDQGRALLKSLREHPHGPAWNFPCGDRLTAERLARVVDYERAPESEPRSEAGPELPPWRSERIASGGPTGPPWVVELARRCLAEVPFYRARGGDPERFESIPPCSRADLVRAPWSFVPDDAPLDELCLFFTSGTTGPRVDVLATPETASYYLPLLRRALATRGVSLEGGPGRVALALVCAQQKTYTYATVSAFLGNAGCVKVNLNPVDWRDAADAVLFLEDLAPEILTGDPVSFHVLAESQTTLKPKALVSSAMALSPGLTKRLEERFGCPVLDFYSTCESGPIAVRESGSWSLLPHDLHVEILGPSGETLPLGERGEIAVTVGRNPLLPLLRYRVGDTARLVRHGDSLRLEDFEGREPVAFRSASGAVFNNLDVSGALRAFPLANASVVQRADGSVRVTATGLAGLEERVRAALVPLFGEATPMELEEAVETGEKRVPYVSERDWLA